MEHGVSTATHTPLVGAALEPSERRLRGAWLVLARLTSVTVVVFALSVFIADQLPTFSELRQVCVAHCLSGQLTPGQAHALGQFGISLTVYAVYGIALTLLTSSVWFGAAALIFWRRSDTPFLLLVALQCVTQGALNTPAGPAITPNGPATWVVATAALTSLNFGLLCATLALFPTGRFVPRWMGWLLIPACAAQVLAQFLPAGPDAPVNVLAVCVTGLIIAQVYRYRAVSTVLQRQQTRWVIVGIAANIAVQFVLSILPAVDPTLTAPDSLFLVLAGSLSTVALTLGPVAVTIAVLRYRLFDLGVLLNRTLVYGLLTALLAAVYVGCVVALQAVARGMTGQQNSTLAIVVSTLTIAALFQPLRRRIQAFIDKRFSRKKYDAAKTLAVFSTVLRNEVGSRRCAVTS